MCVLKIGLMKLNILSGSGIMIKRAVKTELEAILKELKINLENNYKDNAHDALKKLHQTLEEYLKDSSLKEKDYNKYKKIADEYSVKMADYHH